MKDKNSVKTMDAEDISNSLALLKEEQAAKGKTARACKRGACEVKDASGKTVDAKEVTAKNEFKAKKAAEAKAAFDK